MDLYWDQLVASIMRGPSTPTKTAHDSKPKKSVSRDVDVKPAVKKKRVRKSVKNIVEEKEKRPKKLRNKQKSKVKDEDDVTAAVTEGVRNISLTSDEGIDISFSTPLSGSVSSIPKVIMRPQHHLGTSWTFWYSVGNKNLSWEQNQVKICSVSSIEQFWHVTSQLQPPSSINTGHTYSVFRDGVLPDWEDEANIEGGRWMISCPRDEREEMLETMWLEILFMMVGEHMGEFSELVNGAEACIRKKGDRLEVWLKDVGVMKGVVAVGRKVLGEVGIGCDQKDKVLVAQGGQGWSEGTQAGTLGSWQDFWAIMFDQFVLSSRI